MPIRIDKKEHRISLAWWAMVVVVTIIIGGFYLIIDDVRDQAGRTANVAAQNSRLLAQNSRLIADVETQALETKRVARETQRIAREGEQAHDALCALSSDIERRITASEDFLDEHPEGIPGIPPATIRTSIENQQATLESLKKLRC